MIFLIRHGITRGNQERLYYGSTDLELAPEGIRELKQLRYDVPEDCRFFTSGMRRTEQTLSLLFGEVPHTAEPRLREMDFGRFEMRSYQQLKDDPDYLAWIDGDIFANVPPGGESSYQMAQRALEAFREIAAAAENAVIVTHGGCIAAIMTTLFPEARKNIYEWQPHPGHGYCLRDGGYIPIP